jgi:hypothetical protein
VVDAVVDDEVVDNATLFVFNNELNLLRFNVLGNVGVLDIEVADGIGTPADA